MKKKPKFEDPSFRPPKAMMQLVDAFTDTYKPVEREEYADELFPVRRLRDYFQAWPVPKMPDPLPPYLNELEKRGYPMQTSYDGTPALFCVRWRVRGEVCTVEETTDNVQDDGNVRTGLTSMKALIARRMEQRKSDEEDDLDDTGSDEGENDEDTDW